MIGILKRIALAGLLTLASSGWAEEGWQLKKDKHGIKVYTRPVEGSKVNELKATMRMRTTVDRLLAVYLDPAKATAWVPSCQKARLVERKGDSSESVYFMINNPWPISDRDYVLRSVVTRNPETGEAVIEFNDVKDVPAEKCCVRMGMVKGSWHLVPEADGQVMVTYLYHFHPGGGSLPPMLNFSLPILANATMSQLNAVATKENPAEADTVRRAETKE